MIDDCIGLRHARAVWDFTTGDARRFCDRLELAVDAIEQFKEQNIAPDFVLLLHGAATQFAARTLSGSKFKEPAGEHFSAGHELLRRFAALGGRIVVCGIAMERSGIAPREHPRWCRHRAQRVREFRRPAEPGLRLHSDLIKSDRIAGGERCDQRPQRRASALTGLEFRLCSALNPSYYWPGSEGEVLCELHVEIAGAWH